MMPKDPNEFSWLSALMYAGLAGAAGLMGHLMRTIDSGQKINPGRAVLEAFAAGFVGLLVVLICGELNLSWRWTGVIVGVSGWLGANVSIRMLELLVRKRLGVQDNFAPTQVFNEGDDNEHHK